VEQPRGLHGRERGSFLWVVQVDREEEFVGWNCFQKYKF
jgi:hypothetical protein